MNPNPGLSMVSEHNHPHDGAFPDSTSNSNDMLEWMDKVIALLMKWKTDDQKERDMRRKSSTLKMVSGSQQIQIGFLQAKSATTEMTATEDENDLDPLPEVGDQVLEDLNQSSKKSDIDPVKQILEGFELVEGQILQIQSTETFAHFETSRKFGNSERKFVEHLADANFCVTFTDPESFKFKIMEDDCRAKRLSVVCDDYKCWKKRKKPGTEKMGFNFFSESELDVSGVDREVIPIIKNKMKSLAVSTRSMKQSCFASETATRNHLAAACESYGMFANPGSRQRYKCRRVKRVMFNTGLLQSSQRFGYGFTSPTLKESSSPLVLEGTVCIREMGDQPKVAHGLLCRLHSPNLIWPKEVDGVERVTAGITQQASVQEYIKMFEANREKPVPLPEKYLVSVFMRGLGHPLQDEVRRHEPSTVSVALDVARWTEDCSRFMDHSNIVKQEIRMRNGMFCGSDVRDCSLNQKLERCTMDQNNLAKDVRELELCELYTVIRFLEDEGTMEFEFGNMKNCKGGAKPSHVQQCRFHKVRKKHGYLTVVADPIILGVQDNRWQTESAIHVYGRYKRSLSAWDPGGRSCEEMFGVFVKSPTQLGHILMDRTTSEKLQFTSIYYRAQTPSSAVYATSSLEQFLTVTELIEDHDKSALVITASNVLQLEDKLVLQLEDKLVLHRGSKQDDSYDDGGIGAGSYQQQGHLCVCYSGYVMKKLTSKISGKRSEQKVAWLVCVAEALLLMEIYVFTSRNFYGDTEMKNVIREEKLLYSGIMLVPDFRKLVKSCLFSEAGIIEAFTLTKLLKLTVEFFRNPLALICIDQMFHSPRPPEWPSGYKHSRTRNMSCWKIDWSCRCKSHFS